MAAFAHARFSGTSDIDRIYDAEILGEAAEDDLGSTTAMGDVNCDGRTDVLIGAPLNDDAGTTAGAVYVFFGSTLSGSFLASDADVTFTGEASGDRAGHALAVAGDVNGDGCDDVLVGAYGNDDVGSDAGAVYVVYGTSTLASKSLADADVFFHGIAAGDYAGYAVAGPGDVNGDGYDDILVGAYGNDTAGSSAGAAYIIFGQAGLVNMVLSGSDVRIFGFAIADYLGRAVAGAGDFNGDGYADILVGAIGDDDGGSNAGAAYLITGRAAFPRIFMIHGAAKFVGESASDWAGVSLAPAGDVNDDGLDDFLIGAPYDDDAGSNAGATYLYYGTSRRLRPVSHLAQAPVKITGKAAGDVLGYAFAGIGDADGDGYGDILLGAYGNDDNASGAGAAYLFYGTSTILARKLSALDAHATFLGLAATDGLGYSLAGGADIDGDGYDDLIIGAYGESSSATSAGAAYFVSGE